MGNFRFKAFFSKGLINALLRRSRFTAAGIAVWLIWMLGYSVPVQAVEDLETVQDTARKWIDLRLKTSELESDWAWQKDLLQSMQETLQFKIKQYQENEALLSAQIASETQKVEQTREQVDLLNKELAILEQHNQELIEKLLHIRKFLPPRLSDSLDLAYTSLSDPDCSTGEIMQLVVTVLNRCMQFNNRITYSEEIFNNESDSGMHVLTVLYWGLSHAYALDKATGKTYIGKPAKDGWQWIPDQDIGPEVDQLIAVFNEKIDPVLVKVPVQIDVKEGN